MLSNFFVALGGVVPLFCLMAVGVFVKRSRLLTPQLRAERLEPKKNSFMSTEWCFGYSSFL